jgi:hypothetical protein
MHGTVLALDFDLCIVCFRTLYMDVQRARLPLPPFYGASTREVQ